MEKLFESYIGSSVLPAMDMIKANVKELLTEKDTDKVQKLLSTTKKEVLIDILVEIIKTAHERE